MFRIHADRLAIDADWEHCFDASHASKSTTALDGSGGCNSCREKGIHRRERWREVCGLLLLGGRSAGTVNSLLNLTSKTILGCIELLANSTVLRERSTDLLQVLVNVMLVV